jgi:hypothetical protein
LLGIIKKRALEMVGIPDPPSGGLKIAGIFWVMWFSGEDFDKIKAGSF